MPKQHKNNKAGVIDPFRLRRYQSILAVYYTRGKQKEQTTAREVPCNRETVRAALNCDYPAIVKFREELLAGATEGTEATRQVAIAYALEFSHSLRAQGLMKESIQMYKLYVELAALTEHAKQSVVVEEIETDCKPAVINMLPVESRLIVCEQDRLEAEARARLQLEKEEAEAKKKAAAEKKTKTKTKTKK